MRLIDFQTGLPEGNTASNRHALRFIALARLTLLWERLWPALWPGTGFIGVYAVMALSGLFLNIPSVLHGCLLVALFGAAGFVLTQSFANFHFPRWEEAARRIERDSALAHRPLTEGADRLVAGIGDPLAESLWRAHILWLLASAKRLRLNWPHPGLGQRDPHHLRFLLLAGLCVAFAFAGSQWQQRLAGGLSPSRSPSLMAIALNAWISPPDYTGQPPHAIGEEPTGRETGGTIAAPQGSILILRVRGTDIEPGLSIYSRPDGKALKFSKAETGYETRIVLKSDAHVSVYEGGRTLGDWRFAITPDKTPSIAFSGPPATGARDTLKLTYKAVDDYGVTKAEARIELAGGSGDQKPGPVVRGLGPLIVELPVPPQAKQFTQTVSRDLTAHPYAGMKVAIRLAATDAAGQTGKSATQTMVLPERVFTHPLARALIEQRKVLASGEYGAKTHVIAVVNALSIAPERFYRNDYKTYLALRALYWQLRGIKDDKGTLAAMSFMWDMALALEDGNVASAAEALSNAQQALMDALQRSAPDDEIAALMQKLREALGRYLQSLAQSGTPQGAPPPNATMLKPQDLEQILKAIEDLSRTGARDSARQLLQGLAQLLANLQVMRSAAPSEGDKAASEAVQGLSDLMGSQRELLDRTFRSEQGQGKQDNNGLANDQKELKDKLGKIVAGLGQKGVTAPENLGRAGNEMQNSQQGLKSNQLGEAELAQKNALEQLRQGTEALAKQLMSQQGMNGIDNTGNNEDPLGRQSGANGSQFGSSVKVPQQSELQRAREILQELRKRAAERNRPKEELDYIDRLLKQF
jgi:uncharacterized protein (TIGR02302 family)